MNRLLAPTLLRDVRRKWLLGVKGIIFPECCVACDACLHPDTADSLCEGCRSQLPGAAAFCRRCSAPVGPFLNTGGGCAHCRDDHFSFDRVVAAGEYRGLLKTGVLSAKRAGGSLMARWLSEYLWRSRSAEFDPAEFDFVVPVPQHWWKALTASHNTAELIAVVLARRLRVPLRTHILAKRRRTPAQASLVPSARRRNLRDCFTASRRLVGHRVLLVDDVLTTGTTADQASRALLAAGAERVTVAVVARGVGT